MKFLVSSVLSMMTLVSMQSLAANPPASTANNDTNTCTKTVYIAVADDTTYFFNVCTETDQPEPPKNCKPMSPNFKNGFDHFGTDKVKAMWTGWDNIFALDQNTARLGMMDYPDKANFVSVSDNMKKYIVEAFNTNFSTDTHNDSLNEIVLDEKDCKNKQVSIVGYGHGAYAAARAVIELFRDSGFDDAKYHWKFRITPAAMANFKFNIGLIDPVSTVPNERGGGFGPTTFPTSAQLCVMEMKQDNGCPAKYCKLPVGSFEGDVGSGRGYDQINPDMFKGFEYGGVSFLRNISAEYVDTMVSGDPETHVLANHVNIEQMATTFSNYVHNLSFAAGSCVKPPGWP